jgi:hypothetical protein
MPLKGELKINEYDVFKSYYCGLCKELGKSYNQLTRFGLSYDFTFLSLLLASLEKQKDYIKKEPCLANIFKKKPVILSNRNTKYCADLSIILYHLKLIDDWNDNKSIKAKLISLFYFIPAMRAKRKHKMKYLRIKKYLYTLTVLEKNNCNVMDKCADAFGKIMKYIFQPAYIKEENTKKVLGWLGYNIGRWIYILDAYDDMDIDIKENNYNPIIAQYGGKVKKEEIEFVLTYTLDSISKTYELLNIEKNKGILENIIFLGMRSKMDNILNKGEIENEESI